MPLQELLLAASAVGLFTAAADAASYIAVPAVPGSTATTVFAIDDHNVIAGSYRDAAGAEHGFFGTLDGNYKSFDYGHGSTGTEARGITVDGSITGVAPATGFSVGIEFFRKPNGKILTFNVGKQPLDGIAQGINGFDTSVGDYRTASGVVAGYYGVAGRYHNNFNLHVKGWLQNSPRGISEDNAVAGFFIDRHGAQHGFIQQDKVVEVVDYPDERALATALEDINKAGQAPGQWNDSAGDPHAFVLDTNAGTFTALDPGDGSAYQQAWSINGKGFVALSTSNGVSYIYCPYAAKNCPHAGAQRPPRTLRTIPQTFPLQAVDGSTARHLPSVRLMAKHGAMQ